MTHLRHISLLNLRFLTVIVIIINVTLLTLVFHTVYMECPSTAQIPGIKMQAMRGIVRRWTTLMSCKTRVFIMLLKGSQCRLQGRIRGRPTAI